MIVKIAILCLIAVILNHMWKLAIVLNPLRPVFNHVPGQCRFVPGVERGAEDFHLLSNGLVLVSSGLYMFGLEEVTKEKHRGRLFLYDFNKPLEFVELDTSSLESEFFCPHGLSVWQSKGSNLVTVFVINHRYRDECVEVFSLDLDTSKLTHIRTVRDNNFSQINDVVATGENSFYVTITLYSQNPYLVLLEVYSLMPLGGVVYYDGTSTHWKVTGMLSANEIAMSNDRKFIYVNEYLRHTVSVFRWDPSTNDLHLVQVYNLNTAVDNVHVDAEGHLWIGAQPSVLDSIQLMSNSSHPAPAQVFRLKTKNGLVQSMTEIYSDTGHTFSGASSALYNQGKLLIGSVNKRLMICDVNIPLY